MVYTIEVTNTETPFVTKDGVPLYVVAKADYVLSDREQVPKFWAGLLALVDHESPELKGRVKEILVARLRAAIGTFEIKELLANLELLSENLVKSHIPELSRRKVSLVAFRILELEDRIGYLEALGRLQAAEKARDAAIEEANNKLATTLANASVQPNWDNAKVSMLEQAASEISSSDFDEDGDALYNQGRMFELGQGVPKDEIKAIEFYDRAAEAGSITAREKLGWFAERGFWSKDTRHKQFARLKVEAESGNPSSQYELGDFYCDGVAVDQNYQTAAEWFTMAAEQGHSGALRSLFLMYRDGSGVTQDPTKALDYCQQGERWGHAWAQVELASMYRYGQGGVLQSHQRTVELYTSAAKLGDSHAQLQLGLMYDNAEGVKGDYREAAKWYKLAAEQENTTAMCNLAYMYEHGQGMPKDRMKAIELYQQASERGDTAALDYLNSLK